MKILYIEKFKYRVREYNAQTNAIKLVEIIFIEKQTFTDKQHTHTINSLKVTNVPSIAPFFSSKALIPAESLTVMNTTRKPKTEDDMTN